MREDMKTCPQGRAQRAVHKDVHKDMHAFKDMHHKDVHKRPCTRPRASSGRTCGAVEPLAEPSPMRVELRSETICP